MGKRSLDKTESILIRMTQKDKAILKLVSDLDGLYMTAEVMSLVKNRYRFLAGDQVILPKDIIDSTDYTNIEKLVLIRYYYYLATDKPVTKQELIDFCGGQDAMKAYRRLLLDDVIVKFVETK